MGCCQAKPGGISKADRAVRWRSTGIVALRDSKIKVMGLAPLACTVIFRIGFVVFLSFSVKFTKISEW